MELTNVFRKHSKQQLCHFPFIIVVKTSLISPVTTFVTFITTNNTRKLHACFQYTNTSMFCNSTEKYTSTGIDTFITPTVYTNSYGVVLNRDIIYRNSYSPFAWITLFHILVFSYKKVSLEWWLTTQGETAQTWSLPTASKGEAEHDRQCIVQPTYRPATSTETYSRASRMNSYCFWLVFGKCRLQILGGAPQSVTEIFQSFYLSCRANTGTML